MAMTASVREEEMRVVSDGILPAADHPGMDDDFKKFFRIEDDSLECDRLSLMACNRQGVRAEDLLHKDQAQFKERGLAAETITARYEAHEKRRQAKLKLVEDERQILLVQLFYKSAKLNPAKQRELIERAEDAHAKQMMQADGASIRVEVEDSAAAAGQIDALISASKEKAPKVVQTNRFQMDFEKMRAREMKQVEKELYLEVQQEQMHKTMLEKEKRARIAAEQRAAERTRAAEESREAAAERLAKFVETNETIAAQKRQRLEALEKRRQEQEVRKAEESEKLKQERAQLLLNKLYTVAERNKLVQQAFENRCQMQLKDMAHKQQLYFERRKNIVLHRDTMKEINKIKSLQKAISIHENAEKQEEEEEMWKYQLLEKQNEAQERLIHQRSEMQGMLYEKKMLLDAKDKKRHELKTIQDLRYQETLNNILQKHHKKDQHIEMKKQRLQEERELRAETKHLKIQNWIDNRKRINRVEEYKSMVKQAKIDSDRQRTEALLEQRKRDQDERMRQKRMAQREKEKLLQEIEQLRTSPDPQVFLKSMLTSSAGRASSAGSRKLLGLSDTGTGKRPASLPDLDASMDESYPSPTGRVTSHRSGDSEKSQSKRSLRRDLRDNIGRRVGDNAMYVLDAQPMDDSTISGFSVANESVASESKSESKPLRGTVPPGSTRTGQVQGGSVHGPPVAKAPAQDSLPEPPPKSPVADTGDQLGGGPAAINVYQIYLQPQGPNRKKNRNWQIASELQRLHSPLARSPDGSRVQSPNGSRVQSADRSPQAVGQQSPLPRPSSPPLD